ncbi:MAG: aminotransferase class I/II-fold pyridoxal phosphate-dependent enzyme [Mogibacterium sp.]|uniref:pyridoxal phosphate-dependent aminotransferase n=1 Tax=Mogibacterium sp. TaxID=2049035 RepID=UPI001A4D7CDF|nr:histidinol-phosphate transaminase [Mogibacterium sp.]MBL6469002.1 aminotransferase class I/II-fold pyridoxal phosphate-dependent enzyme [Mogibacterium sp.]
MHGGNIYENRIKYDFSVNLNPAGPPDSVQDALVAALNHVEEYPDPEYRELRRGLANYWQLAEEQIVPGNGASELIPGIIRTLSPKTCMVTAPCYSGYETALNAAAPSSRIHRIPLRAEDDFTLPENICQEIARVKPNLLILTNPNNPNGKRIAANRLREITDTCRMVGTVLLMDECFLALSGGAADSLIHRIRSEALPAVVLRAFTKTFAIPGVRLGYAICSGPMAERIQSELPEWNLSVFAQYAGRAALEAAAGGNVMRGTAAGGTPAPETSAGGTSGYLTASVEMVAREREYLMAELESLGFRVFPSDANYILFQSRDRELHQKLLDKGILIRDCRDYHGLTAGFYRTAVRTHRENMALLQCLRNIK